MRHKLTDKLSCCVHFCGEKMDLMQDVGDDGAAAVVGYLSKLKERYEFKCCSLNLFCRVCPTCVPLCFLHNVYPKWCLSLVCCNGFCSRQWYTCFRCPESPKMYRRKDLDLHNILHETPSLDDGADNNSDESARLEEHEEERKLREFFASEPGWATFFLHHRKGNALKYLVANQFSDVAEAGSITREDAELHVLIAAHSHKLTKGERYQFAEILRRISEKNVRELIEEKKALSHERQPDIAISCNIPITKNDLLHYVRGKDSIMENLPQPKIYSAENGDAYVRLIDVLKLYLSFGLKPSTVKTIGETGPVGRYGTTADIWQSNNAKKTAAETTTQEQH